MLPPYTQLLGACLAMLASGMGPDQVAAIMGKSSAGYEWPKQASAWKDCLAELVSKIRKWEVVWALLQGLVVPESFLTWSQVFEAVGRTFKTPADRFAFIHHLLLHHRAQQGNGDLDAWLADLHHAGIDPISLQLCCDPTLWEPKLSQMINRRIGDAKARPINYDNAQNYYDIYEWALDVPPHVSLDGLITDSAVRICHWVLPSMKSKPVNHLGNHMLFGGDVVVEGGDNLRMLGDDVHVYGNLELNGLGNLVRLGRGIKIEGALTINGSPRLTGLPSDLQVGNMVRILNPKPGFRWGRAFPKSKRTSRITLYDIDFEVPDALKQLRGH
jgi:hypothetical protein